MLGALTRQARTPLRALGCWGLMSGRSCLRRYGLIEMVRVNLLLGEGLLRAERNSRNGQN